MTARGFPPMPELRRGKGAPSGAQARIGGRPRKRERDERYKAGLT